MDAPVGEGKQPMKQPESRMDAGRRGSTSERGSLSKISHARCPTKSITNFFSNIIVISN